MVPRVDFDIVSLILRLLEAGSSEIKVHIRNTGHIRKSHKIQNLILVIFGPGSPKKPCLHRYIDIQIYRSRRPNHMESQGDSSTVAMLDDAV